MTRAHGGFAPEPPPGRSFGVPRVERSGRGAYHLSQSLSSAPAPLEFMIPKFLGVIDAINEAHERKKKHRNLSPETISFTEQGKAEVLTASARPAAATVVFGSPKYATPETLEQGEGSDDCQSSDSYALGFIFYEILLGRKLFSAEFHEVYKQREFAWLIWHADKNLHAKPLSERIEGFPQALSALIEGMMMKDAALRTKDLRAVRNILANALQVTRVYSGATADIRLASSPTDNAIIHLVSDYLQRCIGKLSQQTIRAGVLGVSSRVKRISVKIRRSLSVYITKLKEGVCLSHGRID